VVVVQVRPRTAPPHHSQRSTVLTHEWKRKLSPKLARAPRRQHPLEHADDRAAAEINHKRMSRARVLTIPWATALVTGA
jgi:hypothetical protein